MVCLVVFDEGAEARFATVGASQWVPKKADRVTLPGIRGELDRRSCGHRWPVFLCHRLPLRQTLGLPQQPQQPPRCSLPTRPCDGWCTAPCRRCAGGLCRDRSPVQSILQAQPTLQAHVGGCLTRKASTLKVCRTRRAAVFRPARPGAGRQGPGAVGRCQCLVQRW